MLDLTRFIASCEDIIASHAMAGCTAGSYRRWNWQNPAGDRDLGLNEYGCADAANILYTIGRFPAEPAERAGWVEVLRSLQDPAIGSLHRGHAPSRSIRPPTASLPLSLFDARPLRRLSGLDQLKTPDAVRPFSPVWTGARIPGASRTAARACTPPSSSPRRSMLSGRTPISVGCGTTRSRGPAFSGRAGCRRPSAPRDPYGHDDDGSAHGGNVSLPLQHAMGSGPAAILTS